jgi:putative transposase
METIRDGLQPGEVFYDADECNLSWLPTLRALWSPKGQQGMIPTPGQPTKRYGIGAVNSHTGETVVFFKTQKRRRESVALLQALLEQPPIETVYVTWENATTHADDEVEAVVRSAAGRLVLLYLPTYSPWRNPIEMLWRHFRREVTHCELFQSMKALIAAAQDFFARYNKCPERLRSIIGAIPKKLSVCT